MKAKNKDAASVCPVCLGHRGKDSLEMHLLSHSKESLVVTLLQLKQTSERRATPSLPASEREAQSQQVKTDEEDSPEPETSFFADIQEEVEVKLSSEIEFINEEEVETEVTYENSCDCAEDTEDSDEESLEAIDLSISSETKHVLDAIQSGNITPERHDDDSCLQDSTECPKAVDVYIVSATRLDDKILVEPLGKPETVCAFLRVENATRDKSIHIGKLDLADLPSTSKTWTEGQIYPEDSNLSSAIKYIMDENDQCNDYDDKEKSIVLLEGKKYIPLYSTVSELHCSDEFNPPSPEDFENIEVATSANKKDSENSNVCIDLMADEQFPPRGEISEFEESSTSIMSDDLHGKTNRKTNYSREGSLSSRGLLISPEDTIEHPGVNHENVNATIPDGSCASKSEQFICFDACQSHKESPKQFASLFEMIQHKAKNQVLNRENVGASGSIRLPQESKQEQADLCDVSEDGSRLMEPPQSSIPKKKTPKKNDYYCLYCEFVATSRSILTNHLTDTHPNRARNPEIFECMQCGKIFRNRPSLRKHLLVHREKTYVCRVCSKAFPSNYKLMEHARVHTGVYPYKCSHCAKAYRTPSLLSTHERKVHPKSEPERLLPKKMELMCPVCHCILHSKRNLETHLLLHNQKPQKCPHCSETFQRQSVLIRHIRAQHDPLHTSQKFKRCATCGKSYHPNSMKSHLLIHQKEKPHKCTVCHKNFRTLGNLNNHAWSHTSAEKPHKCQTCPKSFIFHRNLQNHMIVHKKKTLHFVCNECGVQFTNKFNLKRHVEEHTAEKKFKCLICGKKFFRHYYLVDHVRTHSGSRPYTCSICGKASSTKSNHSAHLKIHDAKESGSLEG